MVRCPRGKSSFRAHQCRADTLFFNLSQGAGLHASDRLLHAGAEGQAGAVEQLAHHAGHGARIVFEPIDLVGPAPYRILDGFRRLAALKAAGKQTAMAIVHELRTQEEAHQLAFMKNVVRKNLRPVERSRCILLARERGKGGQHLKLANGPLSPKAFNET